MKTETKTKIKVEFYIDKDKQSVFAYFPEEKYDDQTELRTCYAHIGQHSACHPDYLQECRKAKPEEYADLLEELKSIGYDISN